MTEVTKPNKAPLLGPTHLIYILDKSSSMQRFTDKTISEFNNLLAEQKKIDDGSFLSMYQFNEEGYLILKRVPLNIVEPLNRTTYKTSGSTALLDTIGTALYENGDHAKTYVCIFTDGEENSSKYFCKEAIKSMIEQKEEDGWDINYIGSSLKGFHEAGQYGFKSHKLNRVSNDTQGLEAAYQTMNSTSSKYRQTGIN